MPAVRSLTALALAGSALCLLTPASAYQAGDWLARGGLHWVEPKSDNHDAVQVEGTLGITASVVYFLNPQWALDLLVAAPFEHDIDLRNGGGTVVTTMHLPPTLSLVWYPALHGAVHPYVGLGINHTRFFNTDTRGALAGSELDLDPSTGVAALVGLDWELGQHWGLVFDARYMDIDSDASLDGTDIGTVEIDPLAAGVSLSYRFR